MFSTRVFLTLTVGYTAALAFFWARKLPWWSRSVFFVVASAIVLSSSVLLRVDLEAVRYLVAFVLLMFLLQIHEQVVTLQLFVQEF